MRDQDFRDLMAAHLEHYKRYPRQSQQKGEEGTVLLRFRMDRKGTVLSAQIDQKSGHSVFACNRSQCFTASV